MIHFSLPISLPKTGTAHFARSTLGSHSWELSRNNLHFLTCLSCPALRWKSLQSAKDCRALPPPVPSGYAQNKIFCVREAQFIPGQFLRNCTRITCAFWLVSIALCFVAVACNPQRIAALRRRLCPAGTPRTIDPAPSLHNLFLDSALLYRHSISMSMAFPPHQTPALTAVPVAGMIAVPWFRETCTQNRLSTCAAMSSAVFGFTNLMQGKKPQPIAAHGVPALSD